MTIKCCRCHTEVAAGICHECRDNDIIRAVADLTKNLVEVEAQNTRNFIASNQWREKYILLAAAVRKELARVAPLSQIRVELEKALLEIEG